MGHIAHNGPRKDFIYKRVYIYISPIPSMMRNTFASLFSSEYSGENHVSSQAQQQKVG